MKTREKRRQEERTEDIVPNRNRTQGGKARSQERKSRRKCQLKRGKVKQGENGSKVGRGVVFCTGGEGKG